jgi:hypothetical protein
MHENTTLSTKRPSISEQLDVENKNLGKIKTYQKFVLFFINQGVIR